MALEAALRLGPRRGLCAPHACEEPATRGLVRALGHREALCNRAHLFLGPWWATARREGGAALEASVEGSPRPWGNDGMGDGGWGRCTGLTSRQPSQRQEGHPWPCSRARRGLRVAVQPPQLPVLGKIRLEKVNKGKNPRR